MHDFHHTYLRVWADTRSTLILPRLHTGGVKTHRHRVHHENRWPQSSPTSGVRSHLQNHWLAYRRQRWPNTANPHLLITVATAPGTGPVSHAWERSLRGQAATPDRLRIDRQKIAAEQRLDGKLLLSGAKDGSVRLWDSFRKESQACIFERQQGMARKWQGTTDVGNDHVRSLW